MSESIISAENYNEVKELLLSVDEASAEIGRTILENVDYDESEIYILCLIRECMKVTFKDNVRVFATNYPILYEKVKTKASENTYDIGNLSLRKIYEIAMQKKNPKDLAFICNCFEKDLIDILKKYGLSIVDYVTITVTPKEPIVVEVADKELTLDALTK